MPHPAFLFQRPLQLAAARNATCARPVLDAWPARRSSHCAALQLINDMLTFGMGVCQRTAHRRDSENATARVFALRQHADMDTVVPQSKRKFSPELPWEGQRCSLERKLPFPAGVTLQERYQPLANCNA
jgi:hypothetical protein